jgi:hypothetical protein
MKSRVAVLIACSGLVAAGCGVAPSSPPEGTSVTEVDGVRVVENVAPAWPGNEPWTISPEPVLTLGVDIGAPEQMFTAIRTPFALSDGRIVVVDFANAVRLFDAAGSSTGSVGRAGEGPCEFRQVIAAYPAGDDSILVWDSRLRRFVLFDSSGECVGTHSLEGHGEDYGSASVAGRFADGSLFPLPAGRQSAAAVVRAAVPGGRHRQRASGRLRRETGHRGARRQRLSCSGGDDRGARVRRRRQPRATLQPPL